MAARVTRESGRRKGRQGWREFSGVCLQQSLDLIRHEENAENITPLSPDNRSPSRRCGNKMLVFMSCLIFPNLQHAFKRLTSYGGKYGHGGDYTKMLGELFFKQGESERKENDLSLVDEDIETLPYEVLKTYEVKA